MTQKTQRNHYLKEVIAGHSYLNANGNEYLYIGKMHATRTEIYEDKELREEGFLTEETYLNSAEYKNQEHPEYFCYVKVTDKNRDDLKRFETIADYLTEEKDEALKCLKHQMKVVSEANKIMTDNLVSVFCYTLQSWQSNKRRYTCNYFKRIKR